MCYPTILYQVTAPHFCGGIVVKGDRVIAAAPEFQWTIGKSRDELRRYFKRKGWTVEFVSRSLPEEAVNLPDD